MAPPPRDPIELAWVAAEVHRRLFGDAAPLRVGRFELRGRLGHGAMGTVWAAVDPELDREVAIKVLFGDDRDAARLRREAQAMARLRHPNVVAVYEVGTWREVPFVAMERVDGPTLRGWMSETRTVQEVLAVFEGAGRGLAAAHAAGLVHGDFKPDNVLVDAAGAARVADFGLARAGGESAPPATAGPTVATGPAATATQATALGGTPAYMAPELWRGEPATARSDQFAFAVALHEALWGRRPFDAATPAALDAALRAPPSRPARGPGAARGAVPARVRRAIARALLPSPAGRHADLPAFLAALAPPSRRWAWLGAGVGAAALAGVAVIALAPRPAPVELCGGADVALGEAWSAERATRVRAAIAAADRPFAADAATRVTAILDEHAARWRAMHRQACRATRVHRSQPEADLALRLGCLAERRRELDALSARLAAAGGELVEQAVRAASGLPPIERCADLASLRARAPIPVEPAVAAALDGLRDQLAAARAAYLAGRYDEARAGARAVATDPAAAAHAPLAAEAGTLAGVAGYRAGDHGAAEAELEAALTAAIAAGDDLVAGEAATALAHGVGYVAGRLADGQRWARVAEAQVQRAGDDLALRAALANTQGNLADAAGDYHAAAAAFARAAQAWRALPGDHRVDLGGALQNQGNALRFLGRHVDALALLEEAERTWRGVLGAEHPLLAMVAGNLAVALRAAGRHDEALAWSERALAIDRANFPPDHPNVGMSLGAIGVGLLAAERPAEALARFEEALALFTARLGGEHPLVAATTTNVGMALTALGRLDEARAALDGSLALKLALRGDRHPSLTSTLRAQGELALRAGQPREAVARFERAVAIDLAAHGDDTPTVAAALVGAGRAHLALGDAGRAVTALERAELLLQRPGAAPAELAEARALLTTARAAAAPAR
ncbi:MAG: serine/threonine-protein kinase [Myxococcales bacterium]|nr:serine/threonine-protein kinase [Myxococcales bacterium]